MSEFEGDLEAAGPVFCRKYKPLGGVGWSDAGRQKLGIAPKLMGEMGVQESLYEKQNKTT